MLQSFESMTHSPKSMKSPDVRISLAQSGCLTWQVQPRAGSDVMQAYTPYSRPTNYSQEMKIEYLLKNILHTAKQLGFVLN